MMQSRKRNGIRRMAMRRARSATDDPAARRAIDSTAPPPVCFSRLLPCPLWLMQPHSRPRSAGLSVQAWSRPSSMIRGARKFSGKMTHPQSFAESSAT
jgi:hypothetical protein